MNVTFITSNKYKLMLLREYLELKIDHIDLDLEEIQSLDLNEIIGHKAKQAYTKIQKPVLVEDIGLQINSLGRLPGPFIKWFLKEIGDAGICRLLSDFEDRSAIANVCYGYFDGKTLKKFYGEVSGRISEQPRGEGHGWNTIFIPDGQDKTYAEMEDQWIGQYGIRASTVYPELKKFLSQSA